MAAKDAIHRDTLQSVPTQAVRERYRHLWREEKLFHKRKKRETESRELDGIKMNCSRNEARKFYENMKCQTGGLRATACRDQHGNLVSDIQGMLRLWRKHFDGLLNGNMITDEVEPEIPFTDHE